jgi:hypothetical protein
MHRLSRYCDTWVPLECSFLPPWFFIKSMSLGPTIEEFASTHQLPARWLELRNICNRLVARADFWYRPDLRNEARELAVDASDILHLALAQRD